MKIDALPSATSLVRTAVGQYDDNCRELDVPTLLAFWKDNKYPLLALNHSKESPALLNLPEFQAARDEENAVHDSLKAEYKTVRERWAQAGIRCILIKSGGVYPSFPYTSDNLDILIKEEDETAARAILRQEGYVELKNIEEPKKFLFRKFVQGESVSAIHLHTQVAWLVGFMDNEALRERAQAAPDDADDTVPSPEDIILITLAHSFYENKTFRLADLAKVHEWWGRDDIDWEYTERVAAQRGWLDGLCFCGLLCAHLEEAVWGEATLPKAIHERWQKNLKRWPLVNWYYRRVIRRVPVSLPFNVSFFFSKVLYYKKIYNDRRESFASKISDTLLTLLIGFRLKARIRLNPPFLVSFSGSDGSGKTVHVRNLESSLAKCGLRPKYYWSRTATSRTIRFFSRIVKGLKKSPTPTDENQEPSAVGRQARMNNTLLRFFWVYLVAMDMIWSYFIRVRLPTLWAKVVICDRYVYDAAAEMECSLLPQDRIHRLAIRLMLALTCKPDMAYFLDVPDGVSARRKSENTDPDYLRQQREIYQRMIKRYNINVRNNDGDFGAIADAITTEVANAYYDNYEKRFITRLGQLFVFRANRTGRNKETKL